MNSRFAGLLTAVLGVLAIKLTLSGEYLNYVRAGMYPWLLLSGLFLMGLGLVGWRSARLDGAHHHDDSGVDGHSHGLSQAAWLLILPLLAAGLLRPAPLGSFAANRQSSRPPRPSADTATLAQKVVKVKPAEAQPAPATELGGLPIPASSSDVSEMSLIDFLEITYYDETKALAGVPVTIVGFAMPAQAGHPDEFLLSRFMINCCAADAQILQTAVTQVSGLVPQQDSWVSVTGTWDPNAGEAMTPDGFPIPKLVASKVVGISQPDNPYLSLAQ